MGVIVVLIGIGVIAWATLFPVAHQIDRRAEPPEIAAAGVPVPTSSTPPAPAESPVEDPEPLETTADTPASPAEPEPPQLGRVAEIRRLAGSDLPAAGADALELLREPESLSVEEFDELLAVVVDWGSPEASPTLGVLLLSGPTAHVRARAAEAATRLDPDLAFRVLVDWAWLEPDDGLRRLAVRLLARIDLPEAHASLRRLREVLDDPELQDLIDRALAEREPR